MQISYFSYRNGLLLVMSAVFLTLSTRSDGVASLPPPETTAESYMVSSLPRLSTPYPLQGVGPGVSVHGQSDMFSFNFNECSETYFGYNWPKPSAPASRAFHSDIKIDLTGYPITRLNN